MIVRSPGSTIGGTSAAQRNVISGNQQTGLYIQGTTATGNTVQGNYIGTDLTGQNAVPNLGVQSGIHVQGSSNLIGGEAGGGNVVSGNQQHAITVSTANATANIIAGNIVGVAADGDTPLGNGGIGVDVVQAPLNQIGLPGEGRNIIANNGLGIQVRTGANGVVIRNNRITNNSSGVRIEDIVDGLVGGAAAGDGNVVQNNSGTGLVLLGATLRTAILGNSISGNDGRGIDLGGDGVSPNDAGDGDEGPNNRQNFPVLTGVAGGVQGTLNSIPNATFRIEFFGNAACDASGNGEGATLLGTTSITTDATGNAAIPLFSAAAGQFVTATATDGSNNTSEFSTCVQPQAASAELALTVTDSPDPVAVGTQLTYTVTVTNNGPSAASNVRISTVWNGPFELNATSPASVSCEFTPLLSCFFGSLASGASAVVSITGTPTAIGSLGYTVTLQADQTDPVPGEQRRGGEHLGRRRTLEFRRHDHGERRYRFSAGSDHRGQRQHRNAGHHHVRDPGRRSARHRPYDVPAYADRSRHHRRHDPAGLQRHTARRARWHRRGNDVERTVHRDRRVGLDNPWAGDRRLRHRAALRPPMAVPASSFRVRAGTSSSVTSSARMPRACWPGPIVPTPSSSTTARTT